MRDIAVGTDDGITVDHDIAKAVDEKTGTDLGIFRNGNPVFVAITQQQQLEQRINGEPHKGAFFQAAAQPHDG
ncbi:MAG: hypothetical protein ABJP02_16575 [Parasphingorhabdus sp.]|uniref:hypothetical protein n=1 Tax=Parasphingorhabdus sp. TaxID=2709688 RepID=UPI003299200E